MQPNRDRHRADKHSYLFLYFTDWKLLWTPIALLPKKSEYSLAALPKTPRKDPCLPPTKAVLVSDFLKAQLLQSDLGISTNPQSLITDSKPLQLTGHLRTPKIPIKDKGPTSPDGFKVLIHIPFDGPLGRANCIEKKRRPGEERAWIFLTKETREFFVVVFIDNGQVLPSITFGSRKLQRAMMIKLTIRRFLASYQVFILKLYLASTQKIFPPLSNPGDLQFYQPDKNCSEEQMRIIQAGVCSGDESRRRKGLLSGTRKWRRGGSAAYVWE